MATMLMLPSFMKSISDLVWVFIVHCIPLLYVHNIFRFLDVFLSILEKVLAFPLVPSAFSPVLNKIQETRKYLDEFSRDMEKETKDLKISGFMDGIGKFVWYIFDTFLTSIYAIEIVKMFNFGLFMLDFLLGLFTLLPFINPCREKLHVLMKYGTTLETKLQNPMGEDVTMTETGKRKFDQIKETLSNQESICKMFKAHEDSKEAVETLELEDPKTEAVFEDHAVVNVFKPEVLQVTPEILTNLGLKASTNNEDSVNPKSNEDLIKTSSRNVAMASIGKISLKPIEEISEVIDDKTEISSTGVDDKAVIVDVSDGLGDQIEIRPEIEVEPAEKQLTEETFDDDVDVLVEGTHKEENIKPEEMIESKITAEVEPAEELTEETFDDVDVLVEETQKEENLKPEEIIESKITAEVEPAELTEEAFDDVDVLVEETQKEEGTKPEEMIESKITADVEPAKELTEEAFDDADVLVEETQKEESTKPEEMIESKITAEVKPAKELTEETFDDVDVLVEETQKEESTKPEEIIESKITADVEPVQENVAKPSPKTKLVGIVKPMVETSHDNIESSRTSDDLKAEAAKERSWVGLKKSYDDQKSTQNGSKATESVGSNDEAANENTNPNRANAPEYNSPKNGHANANFKKNGSSSDNFSPQGHQKGQSSPGYNMEASKLFVFGVDEGVGEEDVAKEFCKFGEVINVYNTGKGYAFVTMATPEQANDALDKLDGAQVFGKEIKVSIAVAKPAGGARGGRGRPSPRGYRGGNQRGGQQRGRGRGGRGRPGYRGH